MAEIGDRKLYLGPRLRVLRRELGINQTKMADELGVSPSYLNHLERNQRPFTGQMLLRLANTYDIDIRGFVSGAGDTSASDLGEVFADPLVRDIGTPRHEMLEIAENYPGVSEAMVRIYRALADLRRAPELIEQIGNLPSAARSPIEWLREYLAGKGSHLPELDAAAEALADGLGDEPAAVQAALHARLAARGVTVRVVPEAMLAGGLRHYDFHRRRLLLSARLPAPSRAFALAYQLAMGALDETVADAIARAGAPDDESRQLLRVALLNYAAAAVLMPYRRFAQAADDTHHDLDLLMAMFGVSFEQLAHRLVTLGRPGARGVPFFLLKIDTAGIVAKRFTGEAFPFARFGGLCPRWNVHAAFRTPGETVAQLIETPDGTRFVTLARAFARVGVVDAQGPVAVAIGCEAKHGARICAFAGIDVARAAAVTIGPTCHLCERPACPDRALPPITRTLETNAFARPAAPYPFRRA